MGLSGVQRTFKFTKYLPDSKWFPYVLSTQANNYYAYDDNLLAELPDSVKVFRTESKASARQTNPFPNYLFQKFGRYFLSFFNVPDTKIKWRKKALALAESIIAENNIDVIMGTAPPFTDFLLAYELSKKYDIPFVIDYRDIWVDNPYHYYPTPYHKNKNTQLEHEILAHSERIIVTTRFSKETLLRRYKFLNHADVMIIPHGYDSEDFERVSPEKRNDGKFVITHSGLFQDDRTPKFFLKALSSFLKSNPAAKEKIEIRFVGLMRPSHAKLIRKFKLDDNCKLFGYVTHSESIRHILDSDVLWLMMKDNVRSPGKLYEYLGAHKPIFINSPEGNMRQLAKDTGAAFVCDADDVALIESSFREMYDLWTNDKLPVPKKEFIAQFDRKNLTSLLAKELALACKY